MAVTATTMLQSKRLCGLAFSAALLSARAVRACDKAGEIIKYPCAVPSYPLESAFDQHRSRF